MEAVPQERLFTKKWKTLPIVAIFMKDATLRVRYKFYVLVPGGVTKTSVIDRVVCLHTYLDRDNHRRRMH